jgi:hypothetical protein
MNTEPEEPEEVIRCWDGTGFQRAADEYNTQILPLREAADLGEGEYNDYDEAFNVLLEGVFYEVQQRPEMLDAAPLMLETLRECVTAPDAVCWRDQDSLIRRLHYISAIARNAIAVATGKKEETVG